VSEQEKGYRAQKQQPGQSQQNGGYFAGEKDECEGHGGIQHEAKNIGDPQQGDKRAVAQIVELLQVKSLYGCPGQRGEKKIGEGHDTGQTEPLGERKVKMIVIREDFQLPASDIDLEEL
jgi:hypothetical protein